MWMHACIWHALKRQKAEQTSRGVYLLQALLQSLKRPRQVPRLSHCPHCKYGTAHGQGQCEHGHERPNQAECADPSPLKNSLHRCAHGSFTVLELPHQSFCPYSTRTSLSLTGRSHARQLLQLRAQMQLLQTQTWLQSLRDWPSKSVAAGNALVYGDLAAFIAQTGPNGIAIFRSFLCRELTVAQQHCGIWVLLASSRDLILWHDFLVFS